MAKHPKNTEGTEAPIEAQQGLPSALTLTIQGIHFTASAPYSEGHPLTALEASALNNLRGENLRNNFASHVKKALETKQKAEREAGYSDADLSKELSAEEVAALRESFASYDAAYTFSVRGTRTIVDPVEAEAMKIARAVVRKALSEHKIDIKSLPEGKIDELAEQFLDKQPEIRDEARKRVEATKAIVSTSLGLDLSGLRQAAE